METKDPYYKTFIEQAPTAIAMLDTEMRYIAVSQQWVKDYKMEGEQIIGRSHYDIFPEIGDDWKANHQKCLNGAIDKCDESPFVRADGSVQWIYWDVRPWYDSDGVIGGLIMHTGDITHLKEKEDERLRIEKILEKTNAIARIGTWEVDLHTEVVFWSKVVREIHEVPDDYTPKLETAIQNFKEGKSRNTIRRVIEEAIQNGTPYDVELELVTYKGKVIWTRAIGQAEFIDGKCVRFFGVFQDINAVKKSQIELNEAHTQLQAIFNSELVGIISTGTDGIINHFNRGAEIITGYSASEVVGLHKPEIFCFPDELETFRYDIARLYGKNPKGFNAALELSNQNHSDTREWTYRRKDGTTIPIELTLSAIKNKRNTKIGILGVATDISERRSTQNELVRKNQLLNFAEEISLMGHWQWKMSNDRIQWSDYMYKLFEIDPKANDIKFETYGTFVHPDDKESLMAHFRKSAADKKFHSFVHRIITNGKVKTLRLLGEVITNDIGEPVEMIGTCQDITEQKSAERKIIEAKENLEVLANKLTTQNTQLADFAHITSHNLRAPVSNLNSLLEFYKQAESDEEKTDLIEKFEKVIDHLSFTLQTLVEVLATKNDNSQDIEKVAFEEVLSMTKEILYGQITQTGANISSDFSKVPKINFKRMYMESIFLNLLGNAIKYRSEKRIPEIRIESDIVDGKVNLRFTDNGLGIDLQKHGHKLFGLNKVFHRHPEAKGVGLFMTKAQVESMGGEISATSTVDQGSTFRITFN